MNYFDPLLSFMNKSVSRRDFHSKSRWLRCTDVDFDLGDIVESPHDGQSSCRTDNWTFRRLQGVDLRVFVWWQ